MNYKLDSRLHGVGVDLARTVRILQAENELKGVGAFNDAAYYDQANGMWDGLASVVSVLAKRIKRRRGLTSHPRHPSPVEFLDAAVHDLQTLRRKDFDCHQDGVGELSSVLVNIVEAMAWVLLARSRRQLP